MEVEVEFSGSSKCTLAKTAFPLGKTFMRGEPWTPVQRYCLWYLPKWRKL